MNQHRSRQVTTVVLVFGAVVFGIVLAGGLEWTPLGHSSVVHAAGSTAPVQVDQPASSRTGFADLADAVSPAVVSIRSVTIEDQTEGEGGGNDQFFEFFFGPKGRGESPRDPREFRSEAGGSGFLVSADGLIATNNHVVEGATELMVRLGDDGREYPATIRGTDKSTDLALIQIDVDRKLPYLELGDSAGLRVGDWVMVIGNPLRLGRTVTVGVVSAKGRAIGITDISFENFIQTDAAINFGNSGGPMVDMGGRVIGIATAINWGAENIGFAVPVSTLQSVLPQLEAEGRVRRGYLGVSIDNLDFRAQQAFGLDSTDGALVTQVQPGTPAADAGLEHGDIILQVDDRNVGNTRELIDYVSEKPPGHKVELELLRDGKRVEKRVTLGERPGQEQIATAPEPDEEIGIEWLGILYQDLSPGIRGSHGIPEDESGIWVREISPRSPLVDEGLRAGDLIAEVNNEPTPDVNAFERAVGQNESGDFIRLYVRRFNPRTGQAAQFFAFVQVP